MPTPKKTRAEGGREGDGGPGLVLPSQLLSKHTSVSYGVMEIAGAVLGNAARDLRSEDPTIREDAQAFFADEWSEEERAGMLCLQFCAEALRTTPSAIRRAVASGKTRFRTGRFASSIKMENLSEEKERRMRHNKTARERYRAARAERERRRASA